MSKNVFLSLVAVLVGIVAIGAYMLGGANARQSANDPVDIGPPPTGIAAPENNTPEMAQQAQASVLVGLWRSSADRAFTREIKSDFSIIDRYEGDQGAGINGEWSFVAPSQVNIPGVAPETLLGTTLVQVVWEGGVEVTYFAIQDLLNETMTIRDVSQGDVTTFTRLP